jgi:hypothetical protein
MLIARKACRFNGHKLRKGEPFEARRWGAAMIALGLAKEAPHKLGQKIGHVYRERGFDHFLDDLDRFVAAVIRFDAYLSPRDPIGPPGRLKPDGSSGLVMISMVLGSAQ